MENKTKTIAATIIIVKIAEAHNPSLQYSSFWVKKITSRLQFAQSELLPNFWLSKAILSSSVGDIRTSLFYFTLITANALFFITVCYWLAAVLYLEGWSAAHGSVTRRLYKPRGFVDKLAGAFLFLPHKSRRLLAKDFKTFFREEQ